jgi:hypothetical protein
MKKWFIILIVAVIIVFAAAQFLIPSNQNFTAGTQIDCTYDAVTRFIVNKNKWQQWWPGEKKANNTYSYKNYNYRITKVLLNGFEATVYNDKDSVKGDFHITPQQNNTVSLKWESVFTNTGNTFKKFSLYLQTAGIKRNIQSLTRDLQAFFEDEKNVYGFNVSLQKVTDEFLITVKQPFDHYPTTEEVYLMVDAIRTYILQSGGKEKSAPMLNVHSERPTEFDVMVAIPTTAALPGSERFLYRKMVLGDILVADVKGGIFTIRKAEEEMFNYLQDHQKSSPAIPYQSLITNRTTESDTAKWLTRLYYPVFE